MKSFNTTGVCVPGKDYMVDPAKKVDELIAMIDKGLYFVLNRPHQYGKTTTLFHIDQRLESTHYVFLTSFACGVRENFATIPAFVDYFLWIIRECMESAGCPESMISAWMDLSTVESGQDSMNLLLLHEKIDMLCSTSDRPIVLIIDEVDEASQYEAFVCFLSMLRENFLFSQMGDEKAFQSVILAGISDVRNAKVEGLEISPWNIAADCNVDMSFSTEEIAGMLQDYEADHQTGMDVSEMAALLREYTSGYPFFVSRLCQLMDEEIAGSPEFPTCASVWTREGFLAAVKAILYEETWLFDEMVEVAKAYEDVDRLLYAMLFKKVRRTYNPDIDTFQQGIMHGFLAKQGTEVWFSNKIFETVMYNYYLDRDRFKDRDWRS